MMLNESRWIGKKIKLISSKNKIGEVLDIGSSTFEFRTKIQPHIDKYIFSVLRKGRIKVDHLDGKNEKGVDVVCDVMNVDKINKRYDLVLCCNLLEHIYNPKGFCKKLLSLIKPNGFLVLTVPFIFPYHPDPIDTMYRPSNQELELLFDKDEVVFSEIVSESSRLSLKGILGSYKNILFHSKFHWILRNTRYVFTTSKVSCLVIRK